MIELHRKGELRRQHAALQRHRPRRGGRLHLQERAASRPDRGFLMGRSAHDVARRARAACERRTARRSPRCARRFPPQRRELDQPWRRSAVSRRRVSGSFLANGNGRARHPSASRSAALRRNPDTWTGDGTLAMQRTRFRGVWMNSATADIQLSKRAVTFDDLRVTREDGIGTGSFTYDYGNHEVRIRNVHTSLRPTDAMHWIEPKLIDVVDAVQIPRAAAVDREWRGAISRRRENAPRDQGGGADRDGLRVHRQDAAVRFRRAATC